MSFTGDGTHNTSGDSELSFISNSNSIANTTKNRPKDKRGENSKDLAHGGGNKHKAAPRLWDLSSCPVKNEAVYFESLPSYHEFFIEIFLNNQLCVLGAESTDSWASRNFWVTEMGIPNFDYLKDHFGQATAPVTSCGSAACSTSTKYDMTVSEFVSYWEAYRAEGHPSSDECLYLKDWHFKRDFPTYPAYSPPSLLCSDWLNEFWDTRQDDSMGAGVKSDDYRFVYMGPKHTWTPFHSDVLRSYSWSANICGRKKWIFFPPGEEDSLRDEFGHLVNDLRDPSLLDQGKYPQGDAVLTHKAIEVIQKPGQVVFVPSGWHHQVFNLEDTISINHNWINGCSIHLTWTFLQSQLGKVKVAIADCQDMDRFQTQCQRILKADIGMGYIEFYNLVATIALHRMCALDVAHHYVAVHRDRGTVLSNDATSTATSATIFNATTTTAATPVVHINRHLSNVTLCLWHASQFQRLSNSVSQSATSDVKDNIIILSQDGERLSCPNLVPASLSQPPACQVSHLSNEILSKQIDKGSQFLNSALDCGTGNSTLSSLKYQSCAISNQDTSTVSDNGSSENDSTEKLQELKNDDCSQFSKVKTTTEPKESTNRGKTDVEGGSRTESGDGEVGCHDNCPHWSHCDCRLAVFDLQRALAILKDVARQPEWEDIVREAETEKPRDAGSILMEDEAVLTSNIEECLARIVQWLS